MADFPAYRLAAPPVLTPFSMESLGALLTGYTNFGLSNAASASWTANTALFYPFELASWATAYQLLWYVGATSNGNIDVGIYDSQQNLIVSSGSTAMSASTNTVQELNITDTVLAPGKYFLAAGCDSGTGTIFRFSPLADESALPSLPIYEQTGLTGPTLTNPGTAVVSTRSVPIVVAVGIQFRSSPF